MSFPNICVMLIFCLCACSAGASDANGDAAAGVRKNLKAFLKGDLPPDQLEISYSDMHGLYGGLKMSVRGTGEVRQEAVRLTVPSPRNLTGDQVRRLVETILDLELVTQQTPDAAALPDESRAVLEIVAGDAKCRIWERVREMPENGRMIHVLDLMKEFAW